MRYLSCLPLALVASVVTPAASAQVIYVNASATGANNGTSWADAYVDLQFALTVAQNLQVWVAAGTYKPSSTGDRSASFWLGAPAAVYGGFAGTEATLAERAGLFDATILSGDLLGDDGPAFTNISDNSYHVGSGARVVDGFTIQGGNAAAGNGWGDNGGGLVAGPFFFPGTIANCTFRANYASRDGGGADLRWHDSTVIRRCVFVGNRAERLGGGVYTYGMDLGARFENCRFVANTSGGGGGGLYTSTWDTLVSCEFVGNSADGVLSQGGGGLHIGGPTILSCTFWSNSAVGSLHGGGGVLVWGSGLFMRGSILRGNTDGSTTGVQNQIRLMGHPEWAQVDHSSIEGWTPSAFPGQAILLGDPAFVDRDGADDVPGTLDDDLRLGLGSPCVDTGGVPLQSEPLPPVDVGGDARFVDSLSCEATGILDGVLDIGARERQAVDGSTSYCPQPPTSLGVPAEISAPCVVGVAGGAVLFRVGPVQSRTGFLWFGSQTASVPFGIDTRCVGGELHRLSGLTRAGSVLALELDLADASATALVAGSTWHFQALFRDAGVLRLSDGNTVTFRD